VSPDLAYLVFGSVLVAALAVIVAYYYSRRRKHHVERAKYKMLDDE
jgi:hypothetical protein